MQNIQFDTGLQEYRINGGAALRFNPADPAVYTRYKAFADALPGLIQPQGELGLAGAAALDAEIKRRLGEVFGPGNDFEEILGGVSLLACTTSGATVLENLMKALVPAIEKGAKARTVALEAKAAEARKAADAARKSRG